MCLKYKGTVKYFTYHFYVHGVKCKSQDLLNIFLSLWIIPKGIYCFVTLNIKLAQ